MKYQLYSRKIANKFREKEFLQRFKDIHFIGLADKATCKIPVPEHFENIQCENHYTIWAQRFGQLSLWKLENCKIL